MTLKELEKMVADAMRRYNAMTLDQQQKMWEEQCRSWVRGEMALIPFDIAMGRR